MRAFVAIVLVCLLIAFIPAIFHVLAIIVGFIIVLVVLGFGKFLWGVIFFGFITLIILRVIWMMINFRNL